jgi:putative MATE family efflux protein
MNLSSSRALIRPGLAHPILKLALPIMLQGVLFTLMGFVDSLMIGQLGEVAISALGNAGQFISFSFLLFTALSIGGSTLISQYAGAGQQRDQLQVMQTMITAGAVAGVGLAVVTYLFAAELIAILTTDILQPRDSWSQVPDTAASYLTIVCFCIPLMLLSQMVASAFNASGDTKTPVKVAVFFNVVNFVGNYILIFGLAIPGISEPLFTPLGLRGAAFATCIASTGQALVLYTLLCRTHKLPFVFLLDTSFLKRIIELGYPNTVDSFYWQGARVFYTVVMNSIGAVAYTGYVIVRTFKSLFMLPVGGLQQATAIHIGKLLGAGKFRQAQASAYAGVTAGVALMTVPVAALIVCAHPLLGLYQIQPETYQLAYTCIWILALSLFFTAVNAVIPGILRAGGDAKAVMNITLKSFICMGAPACFILGVFLEQGLIGAFIGISLEEVFKAVLFFRRLRQGEWLQKLVK